MNFGFNGAAHFQHDAMMKFGQQDGAEDKVCPDPPVKLAQNDGQDDDDDEDEDVL
jgi:hypothetical protein